MYSTYIILLCMQHPRYNGGRECLYKYTTKTRLNKKRNMCPPGGYHHFPTTSWSNDKLLVVFSIEASIFGGQTIVIIPSVS